MENHLDFFKSLSQKVQQARLYDEAGKITKTLGLVYEAYLPGASVGSLVEITVNERTGLACDAEVIGFRDQRVYLMPLTEVSGVHKDSSVRIKKLEYKINCGDFLLGRVIDARGVPIDGKGPLVSSDYRGKSEERSIFSKPADPLSRTVIHEPIDLGVRAINALLTAGKGQRLGIMAGSGVGKSVLLGMMARQTSADVNVITLVGERGREVREFIDRDLGEEGLKRSVVIVATSDTSTLMRTKACHVGATVAEYFRESGRDVLLMMDSVTRFAMAQREIGLSLGEPPAQKGYTPSVFAALPKLLERAGMAENGKSITALYTVLVDGDDMDEPIADSVRSILDGHIVLSRKLAQKNHFPAIDVLASASRVMPSVVGEDHMDMAGKVKEWMAVYKQAEDLITIGAYARGSSPKIDQAIAVQDRIQNFLRQKIYETSRFDEAFAGLHSIVRSGEAQRA